MNRLLFVAIAAAVGLSACSKKEEAPAPAAAPASAVPSTPAAPAMPPSQSAATPNTGKVLQAMQAGGYTYAEVETEGQKVWMAGGQIPLKAGDTVQWGNYAVMNNFNSKSLNRTFDQILFVDNWGPVGGTTAQVLPHGTPPAHGGAMNPGAAAAPAAGAAQGVVKSTANAGGYTYLEVDQGGSTVWVAVPETSVKAGDKVTWDNGMVMRNFNAKSLGRTFDQIVFAGGVTVGK